MAIWGLWRTPGLIFPGDLHILTPSHLPKPCRFSELPLAVSWKLTAWLNDMDRNPAPARRRGLMPTREYQHSFWQQSSGQHLIMVSEWKQPLGSNSSLFQGVCCLDVAALVVLFLPPLALALWKAQPLTIHRPITRSGRGSAVDVASSVWGANGKHDKISK